MSLRIEVVTLLKNGSHYGSRLLPPMPSELSHPFLMDSDKYLHFEVVFEVDFEVVLEVVSEAQKR